MEEGTQRLSRKRDASECEEDAIPEQEETCEFSDQSPGSPSRPITPLPTKRARASPVQPPAPATSEAAAAGSDCW